MILTSLNITLSVSWGCRKKLSYKLCCTSFCRFIKKQTCIMKFIYKVEYGLFNGTSPKVQSKLDFVVIQVEIGGIPLLYIFYAKQMWFYWLKMKMLFSSSWKTISLLIKSFSLRLLRTNAAVNFLSTLHSQKLVKKGNAEK